MKSQEEKFTKEEELNAGDIVYILNFSNATNSPISTNNNNHQKSRANSNQLTNSPKDPYPLEKYLPQLIKRRGRIPKASSRKEGILVCYCRR